MAVEAIFRRSLGHLDRPTCSAHPSRKRRSRASRTPWNTACEAQSHQPETSLEGCRGGGDYDPPPWGSIATPRKRQQESPGKGRPGEPLHDKAGPRGFGAGARHPQAWPIRPLLPDRLADPVHIRHTSDTHPHNKRCNNDAISASLLHPLSPWCKMIPGGDHMRITINLNESILKRVDEEAKRLGTSRGAMLTTWIGEKVRNLDMTQLWMEKLTDQQTIEQMTKMIRERDQELRTIQPGLFDDGDDLGGEAG